MPLAELNFPKPSSSIYFKHGLHKYIIAWNQMGYTFRDRVKNRNKSGKNDWIALIYVYRYNMDEKL